MAGIRQNQRLGTPANYTAHAFHYVRPQDRILLGSDWPFPIGDFAPRKVVEAANLGEGDRAAILGGNAARVFGI